MPREGRAFRAPGERRVRKSIYPNSGIIQPARIFVADYAVYIEEIYLIRLRIMYSICHFRIPVFYECE